MQNTKTKKNYKKTFELKSAFSMKTAWLSKLQVEALVCGKTGELKRTPVMTALVQAGKKSLTSHCNKSTSCVQLELSHRSTLLVTLRSHEGKRAVVTCQNVMLSLDL